jgi:ABC-2 type transport system ATP-binding protein
MTSDSTSAQPQRTAVLRRPWRVRGSLKHAPNGADAVAHGALEVAPRRARDAGRAAGRRPPARAEGAAITARDLRKSYGPRAAGRGVSFEVRRGEIFGLLGPNGAGKTTIVEILEGYRPRTSGDVVVLGSDPGHPTRPWRERIGLVLQECELDPNLTVRETVTLYGSFYPAPRRVDETIELAGLGDVRHARVGTLSGGQRRRVDVAVGIVGDPELVFLDEPTTGFDPSARRAAWRMIEDLRGLDKTVVLTTHYMEEAQQLADRIGILRAGELVALGSVDEIGARLRSEAVVRFRLPPGVSADVIASEAQAPLELSGEVATIRAADPQPLLYRLVTWAQRERLTLAGLDVVRPTLEDMFLQLTTEGGNRG